MRRAVRLAAVVAVILLPVVGCSDKRTQTEHLMFQWADALKFHIATSFEGNFTFPHQLIQIEPALRANLSPTDAWGNDWHYRRMEEDRYQLISPGANGTLGDDDDVLVENGVLKDAVAIYAREPIRSGA